MLELKFFLLFPLIAISTVGVVSQKVKCGYESCPKPRSDMLNVHIIAHTHDDVGWLKTVDQYYYGTRSLFQHANVQYILNSVIGELLLDPNRRFIYVESAFFFKWWDQQTDYMKKIVKQLVDEGRLEFIGGAWSMNDEATTHYQSTIDQFTWGLRKLNDTFGECGRPKIGWQIDPFGHSREFASLLAQMNYDGLFLGRIDYQDKDERLMHQKAEMIWHASDNLGDKSDLFTGVLFDGYTPPAGLCFDVNCGQAPIVDDESSSEYNLDEKSDAFFKVVDKMKMKYRTNNLLMTMGGDFHYESAQTWYINLDRLIKHVNGLQSNGSTVNVFYSTPSCYLKSLHDSNIEWPTKGDDFFPYASGPKTYWTGYFTSRPSLKLQERKGNGFLQVCKQLSALSPRNGLNFEENLTNLREAMGIMQHHDAVSGTEKQHVAKDYSRLLQIGIDRCSENIKGALNQLVTNPTDATLKQKIVDPFEFHVCSKLNISSCEFTEKSEKFMVTLYNPLAQATHQFVRIPVVDGKYEVKDNKNAIIQSQLVSIPDEVQSLFYRESTAQSELVFKASELPPLGYNSYFIQRKSRSSESGFPNNELLGSVTIGNANLNLTFENGLLVAVANKDVQIKMKQNFYLYKAYKGSFSTKQDEHRASGAYIFRPRSTEAEEIAFQADIKVIRGSIVDEVHQTFNRWISQVVRVYKNENVVEFQWLVGDIPIDDGEGREIITRFDTDIQSKGIFYTDSNGREILRRQRDQRSTWNLHLSDKISSNYYPVTTKIAIEDSKKRFAILPDRAQGGSSLADGSIELMVHRRLLFDDKFGVNEILNEMAYGKGLIVRGKSYLVFGSKQQKRPTLEATERFIQLRKQLPSTVFFSNLTTIDYDTWRTEFTNVFSGLSSTLPKNVHLLTFEPWKSDSILIRFEHILAQNEDALYSQNISFSLRDIFGFLNIIEIRETTLAGNQWLTDARRFTFKAENENSRQIPQNADNENGFTSLDSGLDLPTTNAMTITLKPMEIRTFVIRVK